MKNSLQLLRTMMFVPGHNEKIIDSASKSAADALIFDLEDSVQPVSNKLLAREIIVRRSKEKQFDRFQKFVRLNEIETEFFLQDVLQVTKGNIDGFLLSKTNTKEDVQYLDNLLTSIELERGLEANTFTIVPILESALSIVNINEIAISSKRIIALGFGSEDYVSDIQGVRDFETNLSISFPRNLVPIVARAHNLEAIDAAYINVHDLEGLDRHLQIGKVLGYGGMWILHPKQNELANKVFSPTEEEYKTSVEFLRLYEEAKKLNKGVAIIEGKFVGPPLITKSKDIIARVELIEKRKQQFNS
ncbi:HpcH/HpaI aldolase/citrate lyase family protein [Ulvibacter litoralis]|uniref:Citrate lyase subunit beta / citryl-CoA lyase n=1 Tax=Ulvibacter litoralis TaxID=227084 RepID=A0A1G7HMK3_9FLAO|nr:CoA ester lyase [Ulvibacter litoralis]GHC58394.1 citrate lyase subunit beta [Ulvibacter litoralis]SDF01685.1 citrate lyase subunit beta / citryl-CoA lyase [Ulvibacter litoralis]